MGIETAILATSLAVSAVGTTASIVSQSSAAKKAASAQNQANQQAEIANQNQQQANQLQRQQNDLQAARQKRDAIRQARIARAGAEASAVNQGASDSSSALGGIGSIGSQLGDSLSFLDGYNTRSDQISTTLGNASQADYLSRKYSQEAQQDVNDGRSQAATFSGIAGLGMTAFQNSGRIAKIFGGS